MVGAVPHLRLYIRVPLRRSFKTCTEEAARLDLVHRPDLIADQQRSCGGLRQERANLPPWLRTALANRVRTQDTERVAVISAHDRCYLFRSHVNLFFMEHVADFRAWPKAELHLHLEGSVKPETLQELDPGLSPETIRSMYHFTDFRGFLQTFKSLVERLRTPGDYAHITRRLLEHLTIQNVRYAEITLSAGVVLWKKQEFDPIYAGQIVRQAAAEFPIEVYWILDAVSPLLAWSTPARSRSRLSAARVDDGVVCLRHRRRRRALAPRNGSAMSMLLPGAPDFRA